MITSEDLRFFQAISTHPSLASASRALNVTPPTVTQRLKSIEQKLETKLMDRHSRSVTLTDEGQLLAERAELILAEIDDLHETIFSKHNEVTGRLRVLAPLGFGNDYIAPLVADFQHQYPNLTVELELSDTPDWSAGHSWDVMIYIGKLKDSSLKQSVLATNQRFICASPKYLEKYGEPTSPQDLRNHSCIALRENAEDVTMWRFTAISDDSQESVRIMPRLASNEGRVVKQWSIDGYGIIHRSEWDVSPQLRTGELVRIMTGYELPSADIVALLGSNQRMRSERTVRFLARLKKSLAPKPWD
ncbi:MAG: LysR substrate-binding domain-containing protein [Pseudomonadales bacterium]